MKKTINTIKKIADKKKISILSIETLENNKIKVRFYCNLMAIENIVPIDYIDYCTADDFYNVDLQKFKNVKSFKNIKIENDFLIIDYCKIPLSKAEKAEFPQIETKEKLFTIDYKQLKKVFNASAKYEYGVFHSVYLNAEEKELVATDANRLHILPIKSEAKENYIIPYELFDFKDLKEITVYSCNNCFILEEENLKIFCFETHKNRVYPNYKQLFPVQKNKKYVFSKGSIEFLKSLPKNLNRYNKIYFDFPKKCISASDDNEVETCYPLEENNINIKFGINKNFILDALELSHEVYIDDLKNCNAWVIGDNQDLIMPIYVKE